MAANQAPGNPAPAFSTRWLDQSMKTAMNAAIKTGRTRRLRQGLVILLSGLLLTALAFAAARMARLPSPPTIIALALALVPQSTSHRHFDANNLTPSPRPLVLQAKPQKVNLNLNWLPGQQLDLEQFQATTHTDALLILQHDQLVYESYRNGHSRDSLFTSFSVAKSMLSALLDIAVKEGKIKSLDDRAGQYLPTLAPAYAQIRLIDLLNMRSGIDVPEVYDNPLAKVAYMYATTDLDRFMQNLQDTPLRDVGKYQYRSVDYQLLTQVLRQAGGSSLTQYLEQKLWHPMGAEYGASWSVDDGAHGVEKGFCCINARAIDFLKFGALYLHQGRAGGVQVLPPSPTRPGPHSPPQRENAAFNYSDGWWLPTNHQRDGDFCAIGVYGQYIYINPATHTVIVKFSDHGAEQDEALTVAAFQAIARGLANSRNMADTIADGLHSVTSDTGVH
jgi:CubicO group peptidase (beta-lactamase class C family)